MCPACFAAAAAFALKAASAGGVAVYAASKLRAKIKPVALAQPSEANPCPRTSKEIAYEPEDRFVS